MPVVLPKLFEGLGAPRALDETADFLLSLHGPNRSDSRLLPDRDMVPLPAGERFA